MSDHQPSAAGGEPARGRTDWLEWHRDYLDPASSLSRRRRAVQAEIGRWLDSRPNETLRVLSVCAGDGRDVLDVLDARGDTDRVEVVLLETDPSLVQKARQLARRSRLVKVDVRPLDAGSTDAYRDAVPADLVMMCGVFGNISDEDVRATIGVLPQLCAKGAGVLWTRARTTSGDPTSMIRGWFGAGGFEEVAFDAPRDVEYRLGTHRFVGQPVPLEPGRTFFRFRR
ncbi:MAG TPA: class I SAM-dependent methyltransferase [Nocardioidaceae bacterium]|nr:class I SAM-dependent methyltransferase [Nocardioidaceae bacterium]